VTVLPGIFHVKVPSLGVDAIICESNTSDYKVKITSVVDPGISDFFKC